LHETLNTYVKNAHLKENNSDNDKSLHIVQFEKQKIFPLLLQVRGQSKLVKFCFKTAPLILNMLFFITFGPQNTEYQVTSTIVTL